MKTFLLFLSLSMVISLPIFSQNTLDNAGLTVATPAQVAFSLRKLSSSYNGPAIKVRRSSDNAEATIAFDISGGLTGTSLATFTGGVTVGSTLGNMQTGTISSDVAKTGTITIKVNKTGTITTSNASLTVNGTGTSFTTELIAGDRLFNGVNNAFLGVVASVTNNSTLLLTNFSTVSLTSSVFKTTTAPVTGTATSFTTELAAGDKLFSIAGIYLGTVASIGNNSSLLLNAVDATAATAINYKGSSAVITGTGTNFTTLAVGDLLISNNTTLGIIGAITNTTTLTLTTKAGGSVSGLAYKSTAGTILFSNFHVSTSVYMNTWYDQSGNSRDAIQLKPANQARIVNAGILYTVNGRTSVEFSNTLTSFLQTSTVASYLNNTLYTLNKVSAEATIVPNLQLPISTTGGNGPGNTISHYGYRSSSQFTVAQYGNDQNFNATPSTSLELHTSVKVSMASSQFYKNGISLGILTSGAASHLSNVGLLSIGYYTPTFSYYNGSVSELMILSTALGNTDITLLNNNQLAYYNIASSYWTGAISTSWNVAGNWSAGIIPTLTIPAIVVIPAGMPRYPIITAIEQANSISLEAGTSLTVTGTLQLAGTLNNLGTCTASGGTIQYMGSASQAINPNTFVGNAIQNVIINNTTSVALNTNLTITGNLTFTTGKLSIGIFTLTIGGSVTNTVSGGLTGSSTSNLIVAGAVSPTLSFDQTTIGTTNVLRNVTLNSSGQIITLANNLILFGTGTTTFTAGKLAIGNSTLTMRGTVVNTMIEGLRGSTSANVIVDGTISPTLSFDQTITGTTNVLNNLTLNCTGQTVSLNEPLVIASSLTLTAGTFADAGNQVTSTGAINIGTGTFKLGSVSVATVWPAFTANTFASTGTVEYAAGVLQTVSATPIYQNLTISASSGAVAANDLTVNAKLNLFAANPSSTSGALSMGIYTLNMGASGTTVGQGDITGIVKRTTILPNISYTMGNEFSSISFPATGILPTQMSMKITIGSAPSWQTGAVNRRYDFIQTGGSSTKAVITAHYLDAELNGNVENKLVDFSYHVAGSILTEHGKSNFNTTQNWLALSNVNVAFFSSSFGNIELSFDETAFTTLTWNGSTSTSWITTTNWTPNGGPSTNTILIVPDASTTPNDPYIPATASNGSLTIEPGGIVNADPGAELTLNNGGLAWSDHGVFNAGSSSILFSNAGATINGTTNFNNVTISSGAGLLMSAGTIMRIGGTITNNGIWSAGLLNNTVEYNGNNQTVLIPNGSTQSYYHLIISGSGTTVLPPGSLNILGDLTINGAISSAGNTIAMNGLNAQAINASSPLSINNLTINYSSDAVTMHQSLTVANNLTLTAGTLHIGNNTLTLSGNVINTSPNGITGSLLSSLIVNGSVSPTLSFDQTMPGTSNALSNLTINSTGQIPLLGSDVIIKGVLTFAAGKLGINGNTLTLNGTMVNTVSDGLRGSATSNLIISGGLHSPVISFDQSIPTATNLFNNLTINNNRQEMTLANPLVIGGILNLTDGLVRSSTTNNLTLNATASFSGGSDSSYVDGPLVHKTNNTTGVTFPVGKNNSYNPVTITPFSTASGIYSAEFFPTTPPAGINSSLLTSIVVDEYWDINRSSGPDANISLSFKGNNSWAFGHPGVNDVIFLAQLAGGNWNPVYGSTAHGNTGNGNTPLTSKLLNSFSSFTFAYGPNLTLPVHLLSFKANRNDRTISLSWVVADETDFDHYEIERSENGINFYAIGSVMATNSNGLKSYSWDDISPLPSINFYRLKMIDIDAHYTYSPVLKMNMQSRNGIVVYPNPVTGDKFFLQLSGQQKGIYNMRLYNTQGVTTMNSQINVDAGNSVISILLPTTIVAGVYYLEIIDPANNKSILTIFIRKK